MASDRLAATPPPQPLAGRNGPGLDGLHSQEPVEIVGELECRGVAALGVLLEALEADRLEVRGNPRPQARWGHGFLVQDLEHGFQWRLGPERGSTGQHFIEDRPQAVDVECPGRRGLLVRAGGDEDRWRTACSGAM